jgi:CubicO group peptidase (beta-lactamase class C family)
MHRIPLLRPMAIAWSLFCAPLFADVSFEDGVKARLEKLTTDNLPGMAVLVARDGALLYQGGFGWADLETKTPVTPDTCFRIGSISKQFTAAAILRLADEGKLALDDPLEKFFPGFPNGPSITLRHLLNHTSGLHSYTDKPEFLGRVTQPIAATELVAWIKSDPADFPPGTGFHYNNSGYFLLAQIVAQVSSKPFAQYLQQEFFGPLGMQNTGTFENAEPPKAAALGYSLEDGKTTPALNWDMSWASGAGALYSTVGDLFRWNEALFGGKVLKPESFRAMTTPVTLPPDVDGMNYGFGLGMSEISRLPAISHSGGLHGWSSDLIRLPQQNFTVIALANALPPVAGYEPSAVTRALALKALEAEIAALPPLAMDPAADKNAYPDFVGRYDYKTAILTVTTEDERLFAQITGQPRYEIFPAAQDEFFWKVTDAKVAFLRDDQGKVNAARHRQGGRSFKAARLDDTPAIQLSEAEVDAILGQYQYSPNAVLSITREGADVFAQLTGQAKFRIIPKSASEFEWEAVNASITFTKDQSGKVLHATHQQNAAKFDAPKVK